MENWQNEENLDVFSFVDSKPPEDTDLFLSFQLRNLLAPSDLLELQNFPQLAPQNLALAIATEPVEKVDNNLNFSPPSPSPFGILDNLQSEFNDNPYSILPSQFEATSIKPEVLTVVSTTPPEKPSSPATSTSDGEAAGSDTSAPLADSAPSKGLLDRLGWRKPTDFRK